jgi:Protein of unknown function (DUF2752)
VTRPPVALRLAILGGLAALARVPRNPLVRLEAVLGLSPSRLETIFHVRSLFSGMTEAAHRVAHLDIGGALRANPVSPVILGAIALAILLWRVPPMRTKRHEAMWLGSFVLLSVANNLG